MRNLVLLAAAATLVASATTADARQLGEIPSAFTIAKSSNKNQVSYAVAVNDACAPAGAAPVHPYWRMLERSADATEPLTSTEQRAFGVASQETSGDDVRFFVRGLQNRPITVHTYRTNDGHCEAASSMPIAGTEARVSSVFVKLSLFGVSYVQLTGVAPSGAVVTERVSP